MKKTLTMVIAAALLIGLVGAGYAAYFSDVGTASANTFTSGTLDMKMSNDTSYLDNVTATWVSPTNWAPGETVDGTLSFTNVGSVGVSHVWWKYDNVSCTTDDLLSQIEIVELYETFNGQQGNDQVNNIVGIGDGQAPVTLRELVDYSGGSYMFYSDDYVKNDGEVLGANDQEDFQFYWKLEFMGSAGNTYQGDTCSFDIGARADQNAPPEGGAIPFGQ
jgi:predicted ribosomally synthesized peptide with SipW-like signal peptide